MVEVSLGGVFQGGAAKQAEVMANRDLQNKQLGLQERQVAIQEDQAKAKTQQIAAERLEATVNQIVELKKAAPDEAEFAKVQPSISALIQDAVALAPFAGRDPNIVKQRLQVALQFTPTVMGAATQTGQAQGATALAAAPGQAQAAGMKTSAELAAQNSPEVIQGAANKARTVAQATAEGTAAGTPLKPQTDAGKAVADREIFVNQYGEDSPQVKAFDEASKSKNVKLSDENSLRKQFLTQSNDFVQVRDAFSKLAAATKNPSAAGDLALIFNFMKILDPGSVVREGEFATAQNAASVPDRVRNVYNRVISGERLNPDQRKDFVVQAGNGFQAQLKQQYLLEKTFTGIAKNAGMKPEDIAVDLVGDFRNPGGDQSARVKFDKNGNRIP